MRSAPLELTKFALSESVGSVLRFPLWWYYEGMSLLIAWIVKQLSFRWKSFAFVIWMQNLFVPMYGQYDWSGRLISFLMRIFVLIGRGIFFTFEAIAYGVLLFAYAALPPVSFLMAAYSILTGVSSSA